MSSMTGIGGTSRRRITCRMCWESNSSSRLWRQPLREGAITAQAVFIEERGIVNTMQNFIFISPNFLTNYWQFCRVLKNNGMNAGNRATSPMMS